MERKRRDSHYQAYSSTSINTRMKLSPLALCLSLLLIHAAGSAATATWMGGDGVWSNPEMWDIGVVPNNGADTFTVVIDNKGTSASNVSVNMNATISGLKLDPGDTLNQGNGVVMIIANGSVANNGTWRINSGGAWTDLRLNGGSTVDGAGQIVLSQIMNNRITTDNSIITIGPDQTIQGSGLLLDDTGGMLNKGTIIGDALDINPNDLGFINDGIIRGEGTYGVILRPGDYTNVLHRIEAADGSMLRIDGARVTGGVLATSGSGIIRPQNTPNLVNIETQGNVLLDNGQMVNIRGTFANNGTWYVNGGGNWTTCKLFGGVFIDGNGQIIMTERLTNRIQTDNTVATLGPGQTIMGAGLLLEDTGGMINQGTIIGNLPTQLEIDPNDLGFVNQGTIRAQGTAGIILRPGNYTNTSYTIEITSGSQLVTTDAHITGGILAAAENGVIHPREYSEFRDVQTQGNVVVENANVAYIWGTLVNNGAWRISGGGNWTDMRAFGGAKIDGDGEIVLESITNDRVLADNTIVTLETSQTLRGSGSLLYDTGGMINKGAIIADRPTRLDIDPNDLGFVNKGTIRAEGPGGIVLHSGNYTNTSRTIEIGSGSLLLTQRASIIGGVLAAAPAGIIRPQELSEFRDVETRGDVVLDDSQVDNISGTLYNNGTWHLNSGGAWTDMRLIGGSTIDGNGEIIMSGVINNRIVTDNTVAIIGKGQIIRGAGTLLDDTGGMINKGEIIANQPAKIEIEPNNLGFRNDGLMTIKNGSTLSLLVDGPSNFLNYTVIGSQGMLTGGEYRIAGTFQPYNTAITSNAATIVMEGPASAIINQLSADVLAPFAANTEAGDFTLTDSKTLVTNGAFLNEGLLTVGTSSTLAVQGEFTQSKGTTLLSQSTLSAQTTATVTGGTLKGNGIVIGNLINTSGAVEPGESAGLLTLIGNYSQEAAGNLVIEIAGPLPISEYDVLDVSAQVVLGGALDVKCIGGFQPPIGSVYDVMRYSAHTGSFDRVIVEGLSEDRHIHVLYQETAVRLVVEAGPSAVNEWSIY